MPAGVIAVLSGDGFAVLEFTDRAARGAGLAKLLEISGPGVIETLTRDGNHRKYRVPEGNAREAGLLDDKAPAKAKAPAKEHPAPAAKPAATAPETKAPVKTVTPE